MNFNRIAGLIDISQEILSCQVYPGDRAPQPIIEKRISDGEVYNLTSFEMCAHNGTHLDAPFHFLQHGKSIEQIALDKTVGLCLVMEFNGLMDGQAAEQLVSKARQINSEASKKILFKGNAVITEQAAKVLAKSKLDLIGVELQSVGPDDSPMEVHITLLEQEVCLLEGIRLNQAGEGVYFLHAAPLSLSGFDGAPCRATLIQFE